KLHGCSRPQFFDSAKNLTHDFCSKSHAKEAGAKGQSIPSGGGKGTSKRKREGCSQNSNRDPTNSLEPDVSTKRHKAHESVLGRVMPATQSHVEQVFWGGTTGATNFVLSVLTKAHPKYSGLCDQFISKWAIPGTPRVLRILEVKVPEDIYQNTVCYKKAKGNVRRRFHGTSCSTRCNFFVDFKGNPCSSKKCNVCNICTHGFVMQGNVGGAAKVTGYRPRYGNGLYFSSVSGKSNDYARKSEKVGSDGKKVRCMFVANVTAGNAYLTQQVSLGQNMCPPAGHDSVVGEV
ncbi:unnamed protein product, partial [Ectocarpus fasciculatus]